MRRSRRYSSPLRRAAVTTAGAPTDRSCCSRPSSTSIVVWNDERVEPRSASQFHPPSLSCSLRSRSTTPFTSWPKYEPIATAFPLMHGSTSPEKYAWPAWSHLALSRTSATARRACALIGSSPMYRSSNNVCVVEVHSGKRVPPPHLTIRPLKGDQACAPPVRGDPRSLCGHD